MKDIVGRLAGQRGTLRAELAQGVVGSFALTAANLGLRLGTGVLLARVLGASGLGVYSFATALVSLLQVPTQLGLPQVVVREVAALREKKEWGLLRGLLSRANQGVAILGVGMAAVALAIGWALLGDGDSARLRAFLVALPLLPVVALSSLRQATLRGLRQVVIGQTPELLIQPGIVAAALGAGYLTLGRGFLSPTQAIWLNVGAAVIAFGAGSWFLVGRIPVEVRQHKPEYRVRLWLRYAAPFVLLAGLNVVNTRLTTVMLAAFGTNAEVGVYQVCVTVSGPVTFGLVAANAVLGPHFARFWTRGDLLSMQKLVSGAARVGLVVAVPLALVFVFFGGSLLALFFGEEFRGGSTALSLIACGQLVNAAFGSVGTILNMTGHAKLAVRGFSLAVGINVILNLVLIPRMGIDGAAVATLVTFVLWNGMFFSLVRRHVGVFSLALGGRRWGPKPTQEERSRGGEE